VLGDPRAAVCIAGSRPRARSPPPWPSLRRPRRAGAASSRALPLLARDDEPFTFARFPRDDGRRSAAELERSSPAPWTGLVVTGRRRARPRRGRVHEARTRARRSRPRAPTRSKDWRLGALRAASCRSATRRLRRPGSTSLPALSRGFSWRGARIRGAGSRRIMMISRARCAMCSGKTRSVSTDRRSARLRRIARVRSPRPLASSASSTKPRPPFYRTLAKAPDPGALEGPLSEVASSGGRVVATGAAAVATLPAAASEDPRGRDEPLRHRPCAMPRVPNGAPVQRPCDERRPPERDARRRS